ncbi:hypothetical protein [Fimbriimonas ginsengisoli]|nr:hypothetical protein [Fimbriimonas ginsengisoli]
MRSNRTVLFGMATLGTAALLLTSARIAGAQGGGFRVATPPSGKTAAPPVAPTSEAEAKASTLYGHLNIMTNVGSFKLLGSDAVPVTGALTMSFSGTVLISDPDPKTKVTLSSGVRKDYETKDKTKQVYFGTGTISCVGRVRAIQFFGRDMKGRFDGIAIIRLYGEFDKKLDTGFYWFDGQTDRMPWGTGGNNFAIPNPSMERPKVRVKIGG